MERISASLQVVAFMLIKSSKSLDFRGRSLPRWQVTPLTRRKR